MSEHNDDKKERVGISGAALEDDAETTSDLTGIWNVVAGSTWNTSLSFVGEGSE